VDKITNIQKVGGKTYRLSKLQLKISLPLPYEVHEYKVVLADQDRAKDNPG
jgi:hypothetical protein